MRKDDSGQFLLLTSIVVAIGLVILLIYMNQSSVAGHASSESIMNFPKNDIRELKAETVNQAYFTATEFNNASLGSLSGSDRENAFNASFNKYIAEVKSFYLEKGANVNITNMGCSYNISEITPAKQTLQMVNLSIHYDDSETTYDEVDSVNIV